MWLTLQGPYKIGVVKPTRSITDKKLIIHHSFHILHSKSSDKSNVIICWKHSETVGLQDSSAESSWAQVLKLRLIGNDYSNWTN